MAPVELVPGRGSATHASPWPRVAARHHILQARLNWEPHHDLMQR
jgi:hypothetical protein